MNDARTEEAAAHQPGLGDRLKALRASGELRLEDVASATRISRSFLSLVEAGKTDISIGRLLRLADYFGVALMDLVPAASSESPTVVRRLDRSVLNSPSERIRTEFLASDRDGKLTCMLAVLGPKGETKEYRQHPGVEFVIVLDGHLTIRFGDGTATSLVEGDSVCFDSRRSHSYSSGGDGEARFLSLSCRDA